MKNKIERIMVGDNIVYMKKSGKEYRIVHPIKNYDGSINWKNLIAGGNWWNLVLVIVFVFIFIMAIVEYSNSLKYCSELVAEKIAQENIISGIPNFTFP